MQLNQTLSAPEYVKHSGTFMMEKSFNISINFKNKCIPNIIYRPT